MAMTKVKGIKAVILDGSGVFFAGEVWEGLSLLNSEDITFFPRIKPRVCLANSGLFFVPFNFLT